MVVGTQFTGTVSPHAAGRWFTFNWPANWNVVWTVVSTTPLVGIPQVEWDVAVERASPTAITYWITISNLTGVPINVEARYAITNI
jgi:hypothetical protein